MTADQIAQEVCAKHGLTMKHVRGPVRRRPFVLARREMAYRLRHELGLGWTAIGRFMHRHHTTVIHNEQQYVYGLRRQSA